MELAFDNAIEILEIADISRVAIADMPQVAKRSRKRWHPDRVSHLNDPEATREYTEKFQQVDTACEMVSAFLSGTYQAGEPFRTSASAPREEPEDVLRRNASDIQATLRGLWASIKQRGYKRTTSEVVLSDGFSLRELLVEDFREDIAILSVVSLFYGLVVLSIMTAIASAISPILGAIAGIVWLLQGLSCVLGFAPLSRFWLPDAVQDPMVKFINMGLGIYHWADEQGQESGNVWIALLVRLPVLFAKLLKYVVLLPLYELAKAFVGDKVVGVVKQRVTYYADAADWYVEELINKNPNDMSSDELFHLSHLHAELRDAAAN